MKKTAYSLRLKKFIQSFTKHNVDGFLVTCEPNVSYISGYTGTESFLLITASKCYFLTDFRYLEQAQKEAKGYTIELREKESYAAMIQRLCQKHNIHRLGIESSRMDLSFYRALSRIVRSSVLVPTVGAVEVLRIRKDKEEVRRLKKAVEISKAGVRNLECTFMPGMKEREIQARLEFDTKMLGSEKPAFDMIIACGPNSSQPHAISGPRKVAKEDMLLVDMGVVRQGYHSDLTRCFFTGKIPRLKKKIYDIVHKAQELGIKKAKPGVMCRDVDLACRRYIEEKGYGKYFGHGTGHGVGLEIHENPSVSFRSHERLEPGMVITVEPGIYLPGQFGVRIEDMVLITNRGCEVLTKDIPK